MMFVAKFDVPGKPRGKMRHVTTKRGFSYSPNENVLYENFIKERYLAKNPPRPNYEGGLSMLLVVYMPIPKSTSKKNKDLMRACMIRPTKKPDADNVLKIVTDALNGIAYKDDAQIYRAEVDKIYSEEPCIEVVLKYDTNPDKRPAHNDTLIKE